ncbi:4-hydroxybenzoate octaprenyltransferase [Candidatus Coxiella mudrowiae]|uniref:4-hydroxybenzoate octaprenyltransferase n=1 Tax=Candidatus Coxiella mudrowiae TaxID=2054173 RepID=A0ABM5UVJ6_9COXI|nr:4-hydroxybenzoate octaprenyltransferase [Candidatus Coxiella mudrowiae]AKQ33990.1 4-hydroxybenzoate octaprenyltransferase [Candidatus Coxiella mudrowiae]WQM43436.1 4-hydroxybenzoate octaprenyltransferase [Candidatus Coxiella mudrowiae]
MINLRRQLSHYFYLMRFDKPIGIFLLLWPTLWALWIATHGHPPLKLASVFIFGVVIMRAAGCVINDFADRNIDKHIRRTQDRPLTIRVVSLLEAIGLFIFLCFIAFGLVLLLNRPTLELGILGILLVVIYPFLKRFTHLPQLWLGVSFAWSIPMVFVAQQGNVPAIAWLLFLQAVVWPIAYDTQYAMADREDDLKVGVKSTAILFGNYDRIIIALLQIGMLIMLSILGWYLSFNYLFYLGLVAAFGLMIYQHVLIRGREPKRCLEAFRNNNWVGFFIFLGIFLTYVR